MKNPVNFKKISVHGTPDQSPGFLLWHISTSWRTCIEKTLKPLGLTHPQFVLLASLAWLTRNGEHVTQVALGKLAGLDPNTTSQILKSLEQKILIQREQSSDSRAKNPTLTSKGHEILSQALPAVEFTDGEFFNALTQKEILSLTKLFQKVTS